MKRGKLMCGAGRTKESFREECDINKLVAKYRTTGKLPEMIKKNPMFGDFSKPMDYHTACEVVLKANEQFNGLSAKVRERFNNDPEKFLEFCGDEKNRDEMVSLGLAYPKKTEPEIKTEDKKDEQKKA